MEHYSDMVSIKQAYFHLKNTYNLLINITEKLNGGAYTS